jgi:hypothetical protein
MLITTIAFHHIEVNNPNSLLNNKKHGEKNEREIYQQNVYPIVNHGSCRSQS